MNKFDEKYAKDPNFVVKTTQDWITNDSLQLHFITNIHLINSRILFIQKTLFSNALLFTQQGEEKYKDLNQKVF